MRTANRNRKQSAPERTSKKSEPRVIVKIDCHYRATDRGTIAVPRLNILANSAGYDWLINCLRIRSRQSREFESGKRSPDNQNDLAFSLNWPPFDVARSDDLEVRLGSLDPRILRDIYVRFRATPSAAKKGDLSKLFTRILRQSRLVIASHDRPMRARGQIKRG
jgi:hypothetical protein